MGKVNVLGSAKAGVAESKSGSSVGPVRGWPEHVKRSIDVVVAAVAMFVLSPFIAIAAAVVALTLGRPVLFRQSRPGYQGEPFTMLKFRTMTDAVDSTGELLPAKDRRHPAGMLLRRASLDELPSLVNVLRGEMSLVGPRPLVLEYLPRYSDEEMRRHDALPGLTGLAQVRGRNATTWEARFAHDLEYVDNWSLGPDRQILAATVRTLFSGGADAHDDPNLGEFLGTK